MNETIAEQVNREASIYFSQVNGKGCAINSRITDWSSKEATTTLLFYYNHETYLATYNDNKECTSVQLNNLTN